MLHGSAFYNDIENYSATDAACRTAVLTYLSGWTRELHRLGYVSGVYANLSSGAPQLSGVYTSASYARPDALWIARYDGNPALAGWAGIPGQQWAAHQRAKQYLGGHDEMYGGVTINIDNDNLDTPVATVAHPYTATGNNPVKSRTGPGTSSGSPARTRPARRWRSSARRTAPCSGPPRCGTGSPTAPSSRTTGSAPRPRPATARACPAARTPTRSRQRAA